MTANERLDEILKLTDNNHNSLGKAIGLKRSQILYDIRDGKIQSISVDLALAINRKYPHFSIEWLTTGNGEVLDDLPDGFSMVGEPPKLYEIRTEKQKSGGTKSKVAFTERNDADPCEERIGYLKQIIESKDSIIAKTEATVRDKEEIITLLKQRLNDNGGDGSRRVS